MVGRNALNARKTGEKCKNKQMDTKRRNKKGHKRLKQRKSGRNKANWKGRKKEKPQKEEKKMGNNEEQEFFIFWDITLRSPLKVNWRSEEHIAFVFRVQE
jgi:hypothetical protein